MSIRLCMFSRMSETTVATRIDLPLSVHEQIRSIAHSQKRSLKSHIEYVLERYAEAKGEDGA